MYVIDVCTANFRLLADAIEQFAYVIFKRDHVNAYMQCFKYMLKHSRECYMKNKVRGARPRC